MVLKFFYFSTQIVKTTIYQTVKFFCKYVLSLLSYSALKYCLFSNSSPSHRRIHNQTRKKLYAVAAGWTISEPAWFNKQFTARFYPLILSTIYPLHTARNSWTPLFFHSAMRPKNFPKYWLIQFSTPDSPVFFFFRIQIFSTVWEIFNFKILGFFKICQFGVGAQIKTTGWFSP